MILSNIFEVKKNIMGDSDGNMLDPDYDDPVSLNIKQNLRYKENERFYTKVRAIEEER